MKKEILMKFFANQISEDQIEEMAEDYFVCYLHNGRADYWILTSDELNSIYPSILKEKLWTFPVEFLAIYLGCENNKKACEILNLLQKTFGKKSNDIFVELTKNSFDEMAKYIRETNGSGDISIDGIEAQAKCNNETFYIYRMF